MSPILNNHVLRLWNRMPHDRPLQQHQPRQLWSTSGPRVSLKTESLLYMITLLKTETNYRSNSHKWSSSTIEVTLIGGRDPCWKEAPHLLVFSHPIMSPAAKSLRITRRWSCHNVSASWMFLLLDNLFLLILIFHFLSFCKHSQHDDAQQFYLIFMLHACSTPETHTHTHAHIYIT